MKVLTSLNKCQWKRKENLRCCCSFIWLKRFYYFPTLDDEYQRESKTRSVESFCFSSNGSSVLCLVLFLSKHPLWLGWVSFLACASDTRRDLKLSSHLCSREASDPGALLVCTNIWLNWSCWYWFGTVCRLWAGTDSLCEPQVTAAACLRSSQLCTPAVCSQ